MIPLIKPSVHLNGTSRADLVAQYANVTKAASDLLEALQQASPNGRDFYPQGDHALRDAQNAFAERARVIDQIAQEFMDVAILIDGGE